MQYALLAAAEADREVSNQEVVFAVLLFCCFAVAVVEFTRRMHPVVTIEKLVAFGIGVCDLVVIVVSIWVRGVPLPHIVMSILPFLLVVAGALALIWFDDVIGNMVGLKSGLVSKASPGFLIRLMGWGFLIAFTGLILYVAFLSPADSA